MLQALATARHYPLSALDLEVGKPEVLQSLIGSLSTTYPGEAGLLGA